VAVPSSTITITETTGLKRRLTLFGAGLPKQGANWPGAQRAVTTWYAGNAAQASQHVLGPVERQSQWTGEWNTTRLTRSPCILRQDENDTYIQVADVLRLALEDMLRGGSLLRVEWVSMSSDLVGEKKIVREGRATEWDFQYARIDDINWTITWDWIGRGRAAQKTQVADSVADAGKLVLLAQAALAVNTSIDQAKLINANRVQPRSATRFTLGQLEALVDAPSKFMRDLSHAANLVVSRCKYLGDIINKGRNAPWEIANQALDVANNAIAASNNFVDVMSRTPVEKMAADSNVAKVSRNASYYTGTVKQAQYLSAVSYQTRAAFAPNAQGNVTSTGEAGKGAPPARRATGAVGVGKKPQAVYVTVAGDTLISVSVKFYGTDSGAYSIAFTNGLRVTLAVLPVGRTLLIPILNAGRVRGLQPNITGKAPTAMAPLPPSQPGGLSPAQGGGPALLPPGTSGP